MNKKNLTKIRNQYIFLYADKLCLDADVFTRIMDDVNCLIRMGKLYRTKCSMWKPTLKHMQQALRSCGIESNYFSDEAIEAGKLFEVEGDFLYSCDFKYVARSLFS